MQDWLNSTNMINYLGHHFLTEIDRNIANYSSRNTWTLSYTSVEMILLKVCEAMKPLLYLQIAHSKLPNICSPNICSSFSNWMNAGWNYYLLITNLSNFKNQLPNKTISVLFFFRKEPHPKTKYVIVSW